VPYVPPPAPVPQPVQTCRPCPVCQTQAGAWTDWLPSTPEIAALAEKARSALEYKFYDFVVVRYRTQLVAGTNYAIQVQSGDFVITLDLFQALDGYVQLNTPKGPIPLVAGTGNGAGSRPGRRQQGRNRAW
jgi:hypothetical protein